MVILGVVELAGRQDLRADPLVARRGQLRLIRVPRRFDRLPLRVRVAVDGRAVLRADVVPLAHALRRVVPLPEQPQQLLVAHLAGAEHRQHHLGVTGLPAAHLLIGGVGRDAPRVTGRGGVEMPGVSHSLRSAPQKQPMPNTARSAPAGNGGSSGAPLTACRVGTGIRSGRPASAFSGCGSTSLRGSISECQITRSLRGQQPVA